MEVNVCQSPPFFSIHLPQINVGKYNSVLYMIQCPAGQHSFVYCAETTTIQFLLPGFLFLFFTWCLHDNICKHTSSGIKFLGMWYNVTRWLVPYVMREHQG